MPISHHFRFLLLGFLALPLFAQDSVRQIGDRSFHFNSAKQYWEEDSLPENYRLTRPYTCLYRDDLWYSWYYSADSEEREILELKPHVVFWRKSGDMAHPYGVFAHHDGRESITGIPATTSEPVKAGEGEERMVSGRRFVYSGETWIDVDLPNGYQLLKANTCTYKSETWHRWYDGGDRALRVILDLGPNVFFARKAGDGQIRPFGVFESKNLRFAAHELAIAGGAKVTRLTVADLKARVKPAVANNANAGAAASGNAGSSAAGVGSAAGAAKVGGMSTGMLLGGGALVAGGVIAASSGGGDDSPTKR